MRSFASDNASGVHPRVMEALVAANADHALAYGADPWTGRAVARFREVFDAPVEVAFVWGGTGANVVALQSLVSPWSAVVCSENAHIWVDECGAPEHFTGAKLLPFPTADGKLTVEHLHASQSGRGDEHHSQATVVSLTQSTECGTLYSQEELAELCAVAHGYGMLVHMDGARIANAVAALDCDVRALTVDAGVDVVSFGGTKNGMMYGEAVVFCTPGLGEHVKFVRKQAGQLPSKMRFVAAQFEALLTDGLWIANARHANAMTGRLADATRDFAGLTLTREPVVNSLYVRLPADAAARLQAQTFFWPWDESVDEYRWMTSWDTTDADIDGFAAQVRTELGAG